MSAPLPDLLGLPRPRLATLLDDLGVGARHVDRVIRGLHRDLLPLDGIDGLGRHAGTLARHTARATTTIEQVVINPDGTEKLVIRFDDGARVESVLVPMRDDRFTLCVSSQVGCAMACAFCATGTLGLTRSLSAAEIVGQVHAARTHVAGGKRAITRLVFMGMGEPLHAYDAVLDALRLLMDPCGPNYASKSITVSTVGLIPRLHQLAADTGGRVQLAVSLHAGTDATRSQIVPVARKYPLAELKAAVHAWPLPGSRAIMVEVVVLPGVNDGPDDLVGIAEFVRGLRAVVNLIPFNPFPGSSFRSPEEAEVRAMERALKDLGAAVNVRWPRGRSVSGACGQLMLAHPTA